MQTPTRTKEEYALREKMLSGIEAYFGVLGVWHEWDTSEIKKLFECVQTLLLIPQGPTRFNHNL